MAEPSEEHIEKPKIWYEGRIRFVSLPYEIFGFMVYHEKGLATIVLKSERTGQQWEGRFTAVADVTIFHWPSEELGEYEDPTLSDLMDVLGMTMAGVSETSTKTRSCFMRVLKAGNDLELQVGQPYFNEEENKILTLQMNKYLLKLMPLNQVHSDAGELAIKLRDAEAKCKLYSAETQRLEAKNIRLEVENEELRQQILTLRQRNRDLKTEKGGNTPQDTQQPDRAMTSPPDDMETQEFKMASLECALPDMSAELDSQSTNQLL